MNEPETIAELVPDPSEARLETRGGARGRAGKGPTPGSWSSGRSGNPTGRPRGFAGVAAEIMRQTEDGFELVDLALEWMRDTKRPFNERAQAHQWLSDRGLGRPVANVELTVHAGDGVQRDWSAIPLDERRELLEKLRSVPRLADPGLVTPLLSDDDVPTVHRLSTGSRKAP